MKGEQASREYTDEYKSIKSQQPPADAQPNSFENDKRNQLYQVANLAGKKIVSVLEEYYSKKGYSIEKLPTSGWNGMSPYKKEEETGDIVLKPDGKKYAAYAIFKTQTDLTNQAYEYAKTKACK